MAIKTKMMGGDTRGVLPVRKGWSIFHPNRCSRHPNLAGRLKTIVRRFVPFKTKDASR